MEKERSIIASVWEHESRRLCSAPRVCVTQWMAALASAVHWHRQSMSGGGGAAARCALQISPRVRSLALLRALALSLFAAARHLLRVAGRASQTDKPVMWVKASSWNHVGTCCNNKVWESTAPCIVCLCRLHCSHKL